ncbi:hypothetical protein JB92DRAFT_2832336 [Gautieria morchelliformis]|nr:hypothetical protein JB92DRAFT_2832336 [Gautieria morchelliformis]
MEDPRPLRSRSPHAASPLFLPIEPRRPFLFLEPRLDHAQRRPRRRGAPDVLPIPNSKPVLPSSIGRSVIRTPKPISKHNPVPNVADVTRPSMLLSEEAASGYSPTGKRDRTARETGRPGPTLAIRERSGVAPSVYVYSGFEAASTNFLRF